MINFSIIILAFLVAFALASAFWFIKDKFNKCLVRSLVLGVLLLALVMTVAFMLEGLVMFILCLPF